IPALGVDAPVTGVALNTDGSMSVPDNLWTAAWLESGPVPGGPGKAVIAAHRGIGYPALFDDLEALRPGDAIYVSDASGAQLTYVVRSVNSMSLDAAAQNAVFGPSAQKDLVLVTCFGRYMPAAGTYDHRLVVVAQLVTP
ncbi:MAG: class F sortase, partial [Candidatus Dormibacteraeota bacterium]|nr:class F sortase [Candidatus Dormibacteraeota bacterium]